MTSIKNALDIVKKATRNHFDQSSIFSYAEVKIIRQALTNAEQQAEMLEVDGLMVGKCMVRKWRDNSYLLDKAVEVIKYYAGNGKRGKFNVTDAEDGGKICDFEDVGEKARAFLEAVRGEE